MPLLLILSLQTPHKTTPKVIGSTLANFGFNRVQGSLYTTNSEDLANLFAAITALKALPWLPASVRDIRAFRVEKWSDFTNLIKS
ncbi:MAG: virulence factor [Chlorobium sp.]